jgi:DNA mismatch repair protein MutS2
MHEPSLNALEFPKVLERLARHASFSLGRERALALRPADDPEEVRRRLQETTEAVRLIEARAPVSLGGARDIRPLVERAQREGMLEGHQLLEILGTLQAATRLRQLLERLDPTYPHLRGLAVGLFPLPRLQDEIARCIGPQGEVLDGASARLAAIRSQKVVLQNRIAERMQALLLRYRAFLQEPIITQRQGRYVLAVRADQKKAVRGLVHDHSASGATLYVEPIEVVELGNELRELELAEQEEVRRILLELSEAVAAEAAALQETVETLARFDLILARARYSLELQGSEPTLVLQRDGKHILWPPAVAGQEAPASLPQGEPPLHLLRARHPLLDPATVVPIDLYLGGEFRVLVITGPNTGGKTVALKTVGLLVAMAQSGMHIPAAPGSRIPVVRRIFADIGDEQSIEQSLSTFSAHMTRIIEVLREAEADSLVLLDELGAGTDPVEGSALARALIEALLERGCLTVATTHHSELKAYAYATPGVENACVEFDVETLSPTYVLTIGLPGRSNALAIASRLGLDGQIIARARRWLSEEEVRTETLLEQIQQEREEIRRSLEEARRAEEHARDLERRFEREVRELERQRHEILARAREEAEEALRTIRNRLDALERDLSTVRVTREWLAQAREQLREVEASIPEVPAEPTAFPPQEQEALQPGDAVWVESLKAYGEVLSPPDAAGLVEVQVGSFKMRRPLTDLHRTSRREEGGVRVVRRKPAAQQVPLEIEVRGWRVAEVEEVLDPYLNDAYLAGLPFVRIIHGKGTGTLRRVVREFLANHPLVASFEGAPDRDGGEGVTIAHLIGH